MDKNKINSIGLLPIGTILHGTYRIDSYLSSGGFGNTYAVTNVEFEERYAIKEFFMRGISERDDNSTTSSVSNAENETAFASQLVKNLFWYINDIDTQVEDRYANSIISSCGCQGAIIKRLSDNKHDWVGSIFCEFTKPMEVNEEDARAMLHQAATNIQYILPEIRE